MPDPSPSRDNVIALWKAANSGYSLETYYTAGVDAQGHGAMLRAQVPPDIAAKVQALVENPSHPAYQTAADVLRDALVHRLAWIAEHHPDPVERERILATIRGLHVQQLIIDARRSTELYDKVLSHARDTASHLLERGDVIGVHHIVATLREWGASVREPYAAIAIALAASLDESARTLETPEP